MANSTFKSLGTSLIHAGQEPDPNSGAVMTPISLATTFVQRTPGDAKFEYARTGNPTRDAFEKCVAACENGKYGVAFSSGLAATGSILHLLKSGDHIISGDDIYGGTGRYFNRIAAPTYDFSFSYVDLTTPENFDSNCTEKTKLLWLETPTNPTLKLADIQELCSRAKAKNVISVVDNTFMSPYFQRPLDLGADIVIHSVSKYINGHSDVIMGIVVTNNEEIYTKLKFIQNGLGAIPGPFDSYMALRGMKTLHVRMQRHEQNAMAVAKFLESSPNVKQVIYPGLESHPQHELAKKQMKGFGGMITLRLKGDLEHSRRFLEALKIFALAESLGGVESLAEHPAIMTHASVPPERRAALGIDDSLVRLSVGIEDIEDILDDLKNALDAMKL